MNIQKIFAIKYDSKDMDFELLMKKESLKNALFIFNDNFQIHYTTIRGGGNASIRPQNNLSIYKRSFGIPTGHYKSGYSSLEESQEEIDICLNELNLLLQSGNYNKIVYSIETLNEPLLGTGIYNVDKEVKSYITKKILNLGLNKEIYYVSGKNGSYKQFITQELIDSI